MKKATNILGVFLMSITTTCFIFVAAFLIMLFRSGDLGLRTTLFDAIYFKAYETSSNTTIIELGAYNNFLVVFVSMTITFFIFIYLIKVIYNKLEIRKKKLMSVD